MKVLAIDTSAKVASVSIVTETQILAEFNIDTKLTHSQTLMPMLNAALTCANISISDIDAFAVANGPGSFTGLRIGIGAIKGLSYALNKPCTPVSTLKGLAYNLIGYEGIACAVMDARCNQVYTALFEVNQTSITRLTEDTAITIDELGKNLEKFKKNIFFVGDGADLCYNKLKSVLSNVYLTDASKKYQRAASVGFAAIEDILSNNVCSAANLTPTYLRLPQAQRELLAKKTRR
ncbi:tRNA (adenosine(37)-N6)-threonylcarbamoyltransferase complex dimerization subunit type 1 TsaB [Paludicola sp. MB14-C6]|uniref:tRNA (adenosine(37)-N6)-threonylcarbamoyltransferase complex dimerization subunit type 1 TsaB n=1 Tax=Paludihabitans sp. MB14-C6 TaxID=3070656 RepID=UPI0027DC84D3|nr:tRNA (adenosine(37)-N6)-threonylcarbamoyltransferase complex dimerization subunit type 1 TsaB [Paludicola sp. MB14-C6]WMJ23611.1 tRNA (adenosine(37)-N6)-threonylcarbamoyltransferase complex dimerization subunit type 1 TsaB [Paludicola sp. MB14-C6]